MNEECVTETLKYSPQGKKGWEIKEAQNVQKDGEMCFDS